MDWLVRLFYLSVGLTNLGIGMVGIALPGLPTTIFWIIAAFCFMRSSPRWKRWIYAYPRFGPIVEGVCERREIGARARRRAFLGMWCTLAISATVLLFLDRPGIAALALAGGLVGTITILAWLRVVPGALPSAEASAGRQARPLEPTTACQPATAPSAASVETRS